MHGEVTEEFLNDVTWKGLTETLSEWGSEDLEQIEDPALRDAMLEFRDTLLTKMIVYAADMILSTKDKGHA